MGMLIVNCVNLKLQFCNTNCLQSENILKNFHIHCVLCLKNAVIRQRVTFLLLMNCQNDRNLFLYVCLPRSFIDDIFSNTFFHSSLQNTVKGFLWHFLVIDIKPGIEPIALIFLHGRKPLLFVHYYRIIFTSCSFNIIGIFYDAFSFIFKIIFYAAVLNIELWFHLSDARLDIIFSLFDFLVGSL